MKTLRVLLCLLVASSFILAPAYAAKSVRNRYGMPLVKGKDGSYSIRNAKSYEPFIGDPNRLPDALVPYRVHIDLFDMPAKGSIPTETIEYKKDIAGNGLPLMVYQSGRKNAPVVFFIHGGGWVHGKYTSTSKFCRVLASQGITVVSIEYTFATVPGARMGDAIQDCYDAVDYVLSRAGRFDIDPQRVGFFGSSAGGHLSACCAMHFPQTKAYAGWYGAYDLAYTMSNYTPNPKSKKYQQYNVYLNDWSPEYIASVSPVKIAESKSGLSYKAILFTGTADLTVGPDNARRYREALLKAGLKDVKIVTYKYVTHGIGSSYGAEDMYSKTLRLFKKALK